jgi:hypothetical protein
MRIRHVQITVLALLFLTGCSRAVSPQTAGANALHIEGPQTASKVTVLAPESEHRDIAFGLWYFCADDSVVITSIVPAKAVGGASISQWGERSKLTGGGGTQPLGAEPESLEKLGFTVGPVTVGPTCGNAEPAAVELAVVIKRGSMNAPASYVDGLRINYTVNGAGNALEVPYRFGFCGTEASCG